MRIVIPVTENKGKDSRVSWHFGRAPYFAIYDSEENRLEIIENKGEHFGGRGRPAEIVARYHPNLVFAASLGPRALEFFKSQGIEVRTGNYTTVGEIIENREMLKKLEDTCKEHTHKPD